MYSAPTALRKRLVEPEDGFGSRLDSRPLELEGRQLPVMPVSDCQQNRAQADGIVTRDLD
jgi:hypothetical protein